MGRRSEPRSVSELPVIVRGTDAQGSPFVLIAHTHDISNSGARIRGLNGIVHAGFKIEVECHGQKAVFRVQWVGQSGTSRTHSIGVRCMEPGKYIWSIPSGEWAPDTYEPSTMPPAAPEPSAATPAGYAGATWTGGERRRFPLQSCRIEALVATEGSSLRLPAKVTDLSMNGCYVEMLSPLPVGSPVELILNSSETTLHAHGKVRVSHTGLGMGVSFTALSPHDFESLRQLLPSGATAPGPAPLQLQPAAPAPRTPRPQPVPARAAASQQFPLLVRPSTAEAFDALVRVLFRKGILNSQELIEELENAKVSKS
jgi:hypothetical protein